MFGPATRLGNLSFLFAIGYLLFAKRRPLSVSLKFPAIVVKSAVVSLRTEEACQRLNVMNPIRTASAGEQSCRLLDFCNAVAPVISCNCVGDRSSFLMMALARTNLARSLFVAIGLAGDPIQRTGA